MLMRNWSALTVALNKNWPICPHGEVVPCLMNQMIGTPYDVRMQVLLVKPDNDDTNR